jgi:hypothetical protein
VSQELEVCKQLALPAGNGKKEKSKSRQVDPRDPTMVRLFALFCLVMAASSFAQDPPDNARWLEASMTPAFPATTSSSRLPAAQ